ncbi:MAG: hypothetical protein ACI9CE_000685 [Flavobacterium sp.]|jgi:hypothetical protein
MRKLVHDLAKCLGCILSEHQALAPREWRKTRRGLRVTKGNPEDRQQRTVYVPKALCGRSPFKSSKFIYKPRPQIPRFRITLQDQEQGLFHQPYLHCDD